MKKVKFDYMKDLYPNMKNLLYNKIKNYSFDNGLTLFTLEDTTKFSCEIQIIIGIGYIYESRKLSGISHLVEHMLFEGTKNYTSDQIHGFFKAAGDDINAETTICTTTITARVPGMYADTALEILLDMILNPIIDEKVLEREKSIILQELDGLEPSSLCDIFLEKLFKKDSYKVNFIKSKSSIPNITRKNILNFIKKHYVPSNISITMNGNFDSQCAYHTVKYAFRDISYTNYIRKPLVINFDPKGCIQLFDDNCIDILLGWKDNGKYNSAVKTISSYLLQEHLTNILRIDKALVYHVYIVYLKVLNNDFLTFATSTGIENVLAVLEEFSKIDKIYVTEDLIKTIVNRILIDYCMKMEDTSTVLSNKAYNSLFGLYNLSFVEYAKALEEVTKDDILNFIADLLSTQPKLILQGAIDSNFENMLLDRYPFIEP